MNFKQISTNFIFFIFTQHRTQSHTMITVSKFQFVKKSIIYHCIFLLCHFQRQSRKMTIILL